MKCGVTNKDLKLLAKTDFSNFQSPQKLPISTCLTPGQINWHFLSSFDILHKDKFWSIVLFTSETPSSYTVLSYIINSFTNELNKYITNTELSK